MATLQPGQVTVAGQAGPNGGTATVDEFGYLHHPDLPWPIKTNDTGATGVVAPTIATVVPADTGGTIADSTPVSYKVAAVNELGVGLPSAAVAAITGTAGDDTNAVTVSWGAVTGADSYNVYGRTASSWARMATGITALEWVDNGSVTPSGAVPTTNTSDDLVVGVEGPGHVVGATVGSGKVRPIVDTRNATNVGAASGPDAEAPRVW